MKLTGMNTLELQELAQQMGQPAFRGRQLAEWLYQKSAREIAQMTSLPASFRRELALQAAHPLLAVEQVDASPDGTIKFLHRLQDANRIESVFLPYKDRVSICISTQVGCAMDCSFCATGIGGLTRNLHAGEIVDQVLTAQAHTGQRISHVVYMGMGEPLANFPQTLKSLHLLTGEVGISARRITISTVGLAPAILQLADEGMPITLAVSIHAPSDEIRREIMPVADLHPLDELLDACRYWTSRTKRRITFEYLLLEGVNDSPDHARLLAKQLNDPLSHVNIIPYNHVEGRGDYRRPGRASIERFTSSLESCGIKVTERMRRGNPINAACGQLKHEAEKGLRILAKGS